MRRSCERSCISTSATTTSRARSTSCPRRSERESVSAPELLAAELDRRTRHEQRQQRLPGITAAVVRDGETVWETAVGAADVTSGREATPGTHYRLGSITHNLHAAAGRPLRA